MDKIGKRLEDAQKEYEHLTTTRTNQLDRPLNKINELKQDSRQINLTLDSK
jgi:DNA anti-recombination protein RmuC